jgi:hypothetical protein
MSLEELWKDTSEGDVDLSSLIKPGLSKLSSKDPLVKLKRNLLAGAILGLLIAAVYIFIMVKFPVWQVFLCIGIVFSFTLWASIKSFLLYKDMSRIIPGNNLLQELENHYSKIKRWMSIQQQTGLLIYPVSATGGFMIGGSVGAGKSITEVMQKPGMIIALLIALIILVPLCFYLAKWMSKKAFGKYAEQLKRNIEMLKSAQ